MAASLGASSLAEVHVEGLDQLLHDLANVCPDIEKPESGPLGIPILDALLEVFMLKAVKPGDIPRRQLESPAQREQNRLDDEEMIFQGVHPNDDQVLQPSNVFFTASAYRNKKPCPVVEISSSVSAAGKSQLLYYLTALAVLPRGYENISIGGKEAAVVWIDSDDRFDADRLRVVARGIVRHAQQTLDPDALNEDAGGPTDGDIEAMLVFSLQHVHVFRPQSSSAILATLRALDSYLYDLSRHKSSDRPLQIVSIDSMTAFFWQDKLRDEIARTEDIGRSRAEIDEEREQKQSFHLVDLYTELVKELKKLQGRFGCVVLYTATVTTGRPANNNNSMPADPYDRVPSRTPALKPALPAPWGNFPILRLIVHRDAVRPFPPAVNVHDAERDASMRQDVVNQGKFSAWVNAWDREEWPRRVADGVDWYNGGSFPFYVHEMGVEIPQPDTIG
ncbi:hypothetical protein N7450_009411 [Penicillium hetheringtonii]|uniref:DNA recombination and repair protein Rad51-like C-terminal domain-containing protein n=1 Tax=Penicillium hetheringtonii TaxID=911720 RepID=A0AAD6DAV3_9EURO|nr:hypothetical protein N7450_009411 [Penicillium hetheringtonii]